MLHAESTTWKRVGRPERIPPWSSPDLEHSIQTAKASNATIATVHVSKRGGDDARIDREDGDARMGREDGSEDGDARIVSQHRLPLQRDE